MSFNLKSTQTQMIITAVIASIVFWLLLMGTESQVLELLRIVFGSIFLLFLPGYWLTRVFFESKDIDRLERFALSFALSISVIPLLVFYANLAGLKISALMVWAITVTVIILTRIWILKELRAKS